LKFFSKDIKKYKIFISKNEKHFLNNISNLKKNYKSVNRYNSNKFLNDNSWNNRFHLLEKKILEKEFEINNSKKNFFNKIKQFYNTKKIKLFKYISVSFLLGIFLFSTSIANFIFDKYSISYSSVSNNKVIVVFSGFGHKNYHNLDYLNRATDLVHYQQKYNFDEIIIIGRSAKFDEGKLIVDIISNELGNDKLSSQIILVKDKGSSFNNIMELKHVLETDFNDIKNLNIISSPIYTRRLNLLFKKNLPGYQKSFLSPSIEFIEEKKLNYFSLIYEILATIYYKFKNYL